MAIQISIFAVQSDVHAFTTGSLSDPEYKSIDNILPIYDASDPTFAMTFTFYYHEDKKGTIVYDDSMVGTSLHGSGGLYQASATDKKMNSFLLTSEDLSNSLFPLYVELTFKNDTTEYKLTNEDTYQSMSYFSSANNYGVTLITHNSSGSQYGVKVEVYVTTTTVADPSINDDDDEDDVSTKTSDYIDLKIPLFLPIPGQYAEFAVSASTLPASIILHETDETGTNKGTNQETIYLTDGKYKISSYPNYKYARLYTEDEDNLIVSPVVLRSARIYEVLSSNKISIIN